jgi:hypothetical protein
VNQAPTTNNQRPGGAWCTPVAFRRQSLSVSVGEPRSTRGQVVILRFFAAVRLDFGGLGVLAALGGLVTETRRQAQKCTCRFGCSADVAHLPTCAYQRPGGAWRTPITFVLSKCESVGDPCSIRGQVVTCFERFFFLVFSAVFFRCVFCPREESQPLRYLFICRLSPNAAVSEVMFTRVNNFLVLVLAAG